MKKTFFQTAKVELFFETTNFFKKKVKKTDFFFCMSVGGCLKYLFIFAP